MDHKTQILSLEDIMKIINVEVADGNEDMFPFYESLGFAKRKTVLQMK